MNKAVLHSLTESEGNLVREAEPVALRELDEDELLALQARVQRARTKYLKVYGAAPARRSPRSAAVASPSPATSGPVTRPRCSRRCWRR